MSDDMKLILSTRLSGSGNMRIARDGREVSITVEYLTIEDAIEVYDAIDDSMDKNGTVTVTFGIRDGISAN
jgi:hypothetical protein